MTGLQEDSTAARGEDIAAAWLEERGWEIVERNWRQKLGEIDIVARREVPWCGSVVPLIAFVEVKTAEKAGTIPPEMHVNQSKRGKLVALAKLYLAKKKLRRVLGRFDVIGVDLEPLEVRHFPDAFDASGRLR